MHGMFCWGIRSPVLIARTQTAVLLDTETYCPSGALLCKLRATFSRGPFYRHDWTTRVLELVQCEGLVDCPCNDDG